ncbi:MAG: pyridoxal-phosphate dependent enzyme [Deltaproteobacteria bacterium]|nr:pyridoxal-phosphate dependent enzyme [Deltaproteobacteria bacterium]MBI3295241.1 pyridoxal-phosphate dependent enzyme [Deltaproteobacteria bacterium]
MDIKGTILEAIGNTPLVRLNKVTLGVRGELIAKCEYLNPGGSIKDRIGRYMIECAERDGRLKPGGTIVEATSGNTGMGLAITAAIKGYRTVFVMPDKMSEEKRQSLRAFGAKVVITPTGVPADSPQSHYKTAARLAQEIPNAVFSNQYSNLDNRETHYRQTGPEIWEQTRGEIDAIVIGMGTCGTISGIGRFFKERKPSVKIIGVDPKGSILKELFETGKHAPAQSYKIEGIGEDVKPGNCDFSVVDQIMRVEDKESMVMTRALLAKEGIFVGTSSGSAVVGALRYMSQTDNPGRVLVILPDHGNRYLSKVYTDAWMYENSFIDKTSERTIGDLITMLNKSSKITSTHTTDKIETVVKLMRDEGVSQLPVFNSKGSLEGIVAETDLLRPLLSGAKKPADTIESLVERNYSIVQENDPVERLNDIFLSGKVALVGDSNRVKFILTKIDLISFISSRLGA